jgi:hypothetical protein
MRLAWLVLAHKHPEQLGRLVRRLAFDDSQVFIHVDRDTATDVYRSMENDLRKLANVTFLTRYRVDWGGTRTSQLRATLAGLEEILSRGAPFDRLTLLSGQDYLLRPTADIASFFEEHRTESYIEHFPLPRGAGRCYAGNLDRIGWEVDGGVHRYERWYFRWRGLHWRFPNAVLRVPVRRKLPDGLTPFGGEAYWSLPRRAVDYVHGFSRERPKVVRFFRHVACPEEMFFQTVLLNSPLRDEVVNDQLRYIEWHFEDDHPVVLTAADFDDIVRSGALFARKFDVTVDSTVLDMIDERIDAPSGS